VVRERLLPDDDSKTHYAPGSESDRATFSAHSTQGALWPLSRELPRWKRDHGLLHGQSETPSILRLRWPVSERGAGLDLASLDDCRAGPSQAGLHFDEGNYRQPHLLPDQPTITTSITIGTMTSTSQRPGGPTETVNVLSCHAESFATVAHQKN
jgi:hypothetical protein